MTSTPYPDQSASTEPGSRTYLLAATLLGVAGLLPFCQQLAAIWQHWTTDPLRSIGMYIPVVSAVLAVRAWRQGGFDSRGNWWGLLLAVAIMTFGITARDLVPTLHITIGSKVAMFSLMPYAVQLCLYVSGVVIFFGGTSAWKTARFPILLLLLLNPVPLAFNYLVDYPLQQFGSETARWFASLINVPVSDGTLHMMFAPNLGMFIAPGCNGLRGAVTMGLLALVLGHVYKMRPLRWAAYVLAAVLLAYLFNLLRLCMVVIYYWFALRIPAIGSWGAQIDYVIGGVLFCVAVAFLVAVPRRGQKA